MLYKLSPLRNQSEHPASSITFFEGKDMYASLEILILLMFVSALLDVPVNWISHVSYKFRSTDLSTAELFSVLYIIVTV